MKSLHKIFLLLTLLSFSMACNFVTSIGESNTPLDCYRVTFLELTEDAGGTSTWRYSVEELACAQDLSNWMLELPECATVVDASPSPWEIVQPDPNFHFNGIKWQTGTGFQSEDFSVVLSGELTTGMVKYGVKGPDAAVGLVQGPVCDLATSTSTGEVTPTATHTAIVDELPSPTAPAATVPPPASTGTIIITDNDQTLTFTCNGNAVEVRGNANTITLLESCSSITVRGNGNQVFWQSGSPVITDTGNENAIMQR